MMANRFGLLPIDVNPDLFEKKEENDQYNQNNCLKFYINTKCTRKEEYKKYSQLELMKMNRKEYLDNHIILTDQIKWIPIGE